MATHPQEKMGWEKKLFLPQSMAKKPFFSKIFKRRKTGYRLAEKEQQGGSPVFLCLLKKGGCMADVKVKEAPRN